MAYYQDTVCRLSLPEQDVPGAAAMRASNTVERLRQFANGIGVNIMIVGQNGAPRRGSSSAV